MKRMIVLAGLIFFGMAAWRITDRLSADAIGMALGVLFGVLAGLPVALLVLASHRRREREEEEPMGRGGRGRQQALPPGYAYPMPAQQPPVIVLAGHPGAMPQGNGYGYDQGLVQQQRMLPDDLEIGQRRNKKRDFRMIGETDELIDDYQ